MGLAADAGIFAQLILFWGGGKKDFNRENGREHFTQTPQLHLVILARTSLALNQLQHGNPGQAF